MTEHTTHNPIETRVSTRNYLKKPLTPTDLEKISAYLNDPKNLAVGF